MVKQMRRRIQTVSGSTIRPEGGYVMLLTLLMGIAFLTMLTGIINLAMFNYTTARNSYTNLSALGVAEAGAEDAVFRVNLAANTGTQYEGTTIPEAGACKIATDSSTNPTAVEFFNDSARGRGTFETCVLQTSNGTNGLYEKTLYALGKVYLPASASRPTSVRRLKLVLVGQPGGSYVVHTGAGGLFMSNTASITNGSVFTNGSITMTNKSRIGSSGSSVGVSAANYDCPKTAPYTGYPARCPSGVEPITVGNQAAIYGTVQGNGQTDGSRMYNPGLTASSEIAPLALPSYDREDHKTRVSAANSISGNQTCSSGTMVLAPNAKLSGDLTIRNSCTVIVQGDVWITGKVALTQKGKFKADEALTEKPTVMIDGSGGIEFSQQSSVAANSSGVGIEFITFWSAASCSPDCASVTDADLWNSKETNTVKLNNQALAAGSRFYARWSGLIMGQGGTLGSIAAQKVNLSNSGAISFSTNDGTPIYVYTMMYYELMPVPDARSTN